MTIGRPAAMRHQPVLRDLALLRTRPRKAVAEIDDIDLPAEALELRDHAPVVGVAAGRGRKIARHRERNASTTTPPRTRRARRAIPKA